MVSIAAAQYPITEHKTFATWQTHVETWVSNAARQKAKLLLFPEYGSMELVSLFSGEIRSDIKRQIVSLQELRDDFCTVYSDLASKYNVIIVAPSIPVVLCDTVVNRVYVFSAKGLVGFQDKFFMTRFEDEVWGIQSGSKQLSVFEADWGSFGIQICYDVEFGIGSQILCSAGASLILAPSCTETIKGATRVHIGARARALENQSYTVVAQTVGKALWSPAVDVNYGYAAFYSTPDIDFPDEGIISLGKPQREGWVVNSLDFSKIEKARESGQVFNFKDQQKLQIGLVEEKIMLVKRIV